jgi:hypothetical protein
LASGTYAKNSLGWQVQQISQQVGEWIERLLSNSAGNLPSETPLPAWLLQTLFWLLVLGSLTWMGWQIYRFAGSYLNLERPSRLATLTTAPVDWLKQAQTARSQGDYQLACRALYLAALQRLNERGLIPQALSRTDGEYLALLHQLNLPLADQQPYQLLIGTHERLAFDRFVASADLYDRCWQAYRQLEGEP